jgi:hypothetical protein
MPALSKDHEDLATFKSLWEEIRRELLRAKRLIDEEIRGYPTPIPRCDAQFNHLYDQRARLARELERTALSSKAPAREDYLRLISEFAAAPPYVDDPAEQRLRARLKAESSSWGDFRTRAGR